MKSVLIETLRNVRIAIYKHFSQKIIVKAIVFGVLSGLILGNIAKGMSFDMYSLVAFAIYVVFNFSYPRSKNVVLYIYLDFLCIANLLTYFNLIKCSNKDYISGLILLGIILFLQLVNLKDLIKSNTKINSNNELLYYEREKDKEAILNYLKRFSVFGISSQWGSGKTFIMNNICAENKNKYHFIKIDTTAYNADDIASVIINEMDLLLKENEILSLYSSVLSNICKSDGTLSILGTLLFNNQASNSKRIAGFRSDLEKLDKDIVIVFEDIDRIDDKKVISKIFGIVNNIVSYSNKIKVIYEYRHDKLLHLFNEDTNFIEKYIPYTVNLTHISFKSLLTNIYETNQDSFKHIFPDWFNFLCEDQNFNYPIDVSGIGFMYNIVEEFYRDKYSVRKIKSFMLEVDSYFTFNDNKELYSLSQKRNSIILYFFLKHFDDKLYSKFDDYWNDFFDIFLVKFKESVNSTKNVLLDYTDFYNLFFNKDSNEGFMNTFKGLISDDHNRKSLSLIDAFGINLSVNYNKNKVISDNGRVLSFLLVEYNPIIFRGKFENDRIISFVKSLHEPGYITNTKEETLSTLFINRYLGSANTLDYNRYKDFDLYCHKGQYYLDNHIEPFNYCFTETIDAIFVSMYVSNVHADYWLLFLDFFQKEYLKNAMSEYIVCTSIIGKFNFIDINDERVFWKALAVLRLFNVSNRYPFDTKVFMVFWKSYLDRIIILLDLKLTEEYKKLDKITQDRNFTNYEYFVNYFIYRIRNLVKSDVRLSDSKKTQILIFLYQCEKMVLTIKLQIC